MSSACNDVRVSESKSGPISGNVGNGWHNTDARAIASGRTPRSFASALTRSRRRKLSSLYQQCTNLASERLWGLALPVKKPCAWLDHGISGISCSVNQARDRASDAERPPSQMG